MDIYRRETHFIADFQYEVSAAVRGRRKLSAIRSSFNKLSASETQIIRDFAHFNSHLVNRQMGRSTLLRNIGNYLPFVNITAKT